MLKFIESNDFMDADEFNDTFTLPVEAGKASCLAMARTVP